MVVIDVRVLLTCQPAYGHFQPLVPLLRALVTAGHDVTVATSAAFAPVVATEGVAVSAVGPEWLECRPEATWSDLPGDDATADGISLRVEAAFYRAAEATEPELSALVDLFRPAVIVHESDEFLAPLVAERAGVPWVCVGISLQQPQLGPNPMWDAARDAFGLPPDPEQARLWPHLFLDPVPPSLKPQPTTKRVPAARPLRPATAHPPRPRAGRPLLLVTLGTVFNRAHGLLERLVDGLLVADVDILVATGPAAAPLDVETVPGRVEVVEHVPFGDVLPDTAAVVHHAGSGTAFAVLAAGLPSVVVPLASDQPRNAATLVDAGAAVSLDHRDLGPGDVAAAAAEVLGSPRYRLMARRLASEIAGMPSPEAAVARIEELVSDPGSR